jgi:hypothetical protein
MATSLLNIMPPCILVQDRHLPDYATSKLEHHSVNIHRCDKCHNTSSTNHVQIGERLIISLAVRVYSLHVSTHCRKLKIRRYMTS